MTYLRHGFVLWLLLGSFAGAAAESPALSPEVQALVRVQASTVTLTHVRVIDGTGKPAAADQNVTIEHGKIARIEAGRDVEPSEGAAVLELKGVFGHARYRRHA